MKTYLVAMKKAGLSLALFAFISVLFVVITDRLTSEKIKENQKNMLLHALHEVVPEKYYDNNLINSKFILAANKTGFERNTPIFIATKKGSPVAVIFEYSTLKGYGGIIKLLIGIDIKDKSILGVRVVNHQETPGLGDKMDIRKSNWILSFNHKSLKDPSLEYWKVKKDGGAFDQFTGATITPRAIVNAVKTTLLYVQDNLESLLNEFQAGQLK